LESGLRQRFTLVLGGRQDRWWSEREALARELGVADRVRFIGQIDEEDMPLLYSGAALFAFPSIYEGFGLPPLEAMACGTPVLCSNRASLPEVVGDAGRIVDPEDVVAFTRSLADILGSQAELDRLAGAGLEQAGLFRADAICERQMQLLEKVAERGRR
jgi:glycosyltransferase involved in cell wall biosynthesis